MEETTNKMEKIKLFEMFAGYGGASFALKKAGIPFECVGFSEIDKYAIQCYQQNHHGKNFGDCTKIDSKDLPDFDLLTGGFPCQSFSVAGKGLGEQETRGTLFHEIIRIAEVKQPKYMLLENVKGLTNKKHKATFNKILSELGRIGYLVDYKVLNSKDYGIPQNRERIFFVCRRNDLIDFNQDASEIDFNFPKKEELKLFLKDILEENIDKKYYLSADKTKQLLKKLPKTIETNATITPDRINKRQNGRRFKEDGEPMFTLNTQDIHGILQLNNPTHSNNRIYSEDGISPTLNTMQGGNRQPFIQIKNATKKGYQEGAPGDGVNLEQPNSKTRRGRVQDQICSTLQTNDQRGVVNSDLTIRKLTPTECFRLMGFLDDGINFDGLSNTQRYKLAGNGWDINLVSKIFKNMFEE